MPNDSRGFAYTWGVPTSFAKLPMTANAGSTRLPSAPSPIFTVLTPTYNRADVIGRTFDSLMAQGFERFEWLVIDDGSSDHTADVIRACADRAPFPVRYILQRNGHKKTAFNHGVREARGELLLVLDDDDELTPGTLQRLLDAWHGIAEARRDRYIGVTGLCARADGSIVGDRYPHDVMDCTATDMYFLHRVAGEKFGCQRTDVLRQFPYPEDIPGFVPESMVWWAIARAGYLNRFVNQVVRTYHHSAGSLSDVRAGASPHAAGLYLLNWLMVEHELRYFRHSPSLFIKAAARVTRFRLGLPDTQAHVAHTYRITRPGARLLVGLMAPLGWLMHLRDGRLSDGGATPGE